MDSKTEDDHIKKIMKEARKQAHDMGIIKPLPALDAFKDSLTAPFAKFDEVFGKMTEMTGEKALKLYPFKTVPLPPHPIKQKTSKDEEELANDYTYVDCYLHSNISLYTPGTFQDLVFMFNPTRWSPIEFWNIPHSKKISVPRYVIKWINKTCTPYILNTREYSRDEIERNAAAVGMCSSGEYYKTLGRPNYYFSPYAYDTSPSRAA